MAGFEEDGMVSVPAVRSVLSSVGSVVHMVGIRIGMGGFEGGTLSGLGVAAGITRVTHILVHHLSGLSY